MKMILKCVNKSFAESVARFMAGVCYVIMVLGIVSLVLSFMGRLSFELHTSTGGYSGAIYAEKNHDADSRAMIISMKDTIHVVSYGDKIEPVIQLGLSLIALFRIGPLILAFWLLARVFTNVGKGQIFTEKNATYLLYYGLIQFAVGVFVPFINLLICQLISRMSADSMSMSTGSQLLNDVVMSIAFIVAAYIIHYGISLQDEVDHTL